MKILILLFSLGMGIIWLRQAFRNKSLRLRSKRLSRNLSRNKASFDDVKNSFDTLLLSVPLTGTPDMAKLTPPVLSGNANKGKDTYRIHHIQASANSSFILLAEAVVKDFLPTRGGGRYIDKAYSCNMYGLVIPEEQKMEFWGHFPQDKQHEYLFKSLAQAAMIALIAL